MELHELEDFEDALKFEDPLMLQREMDLDLVAAAVGALKNGRVDDLHDASLAYNSYFRHKALVVLEDLDRKLFWLAAAFCFYFSDSELHASESVWRDSVLHRGSLAHVGQLRLAWRWRCFIDNLRQFSVGCARARLRLGPAKAHLRVDAGDEGLLYDEEVQIWL